ncbi:hypothetical protein GPECTOR_15g322 [Gonium pectorale]|uniref:Pherophorin domain-containing protein n=1 Tax=Gonium pectorale TaxID=33097 RepID=A0A150GLI5_GONPE|nr:hypothetical protein GPECTOR_15g322 [Gonium pectorale]|eukprot:KXZ50638.1 hypothetical protein GPECTOR_15g322 [Gonium pectorale]
MKRREQGRLRSASTACAALACLSALSVTCEGAKCCEEDLSSIALSVPLACCAKRPKVAATLFTPGGPRAGARVSAGFFCGNSSWANGAEALLRATGLVLNRTSANGARLCLQLRGDSCSTVQTVCAPPAGSPAGTCAAMLTSGGRDCCAASTAAAPPSPPANPPPLKPSPRPPVLSKPSPPPPSPVAQTSSSPPSSPPGLRIGTGSAAAWTAFGCDASDSATIASISVCNDLLAAQASMVPRVLGSALPAVFDALFPPLPGASATGCAAYPAAARSYRLRASDGSGAGGAGACFAASDHDCSVPKFSLSSFPPDPSCGKDSPNGFFKLRSAVQFENVTILFSRYQVYCFGIELNTATPSTNISCTGNRVLQVAFYANITMRASLTSVIVRGVTDQRRLPSITAAGAPDDGWWVKPGSTGANRVVSNTLWLRPLDWNVDLTRDLIQRSRAEVCLELRNGTSLGDFCLANTPNTCYVSIYSSDSCCPVSSAQQ